MKTIMITGLLAFSGFFATFSEKPQDVLKLKKPYTENYAYVPGGTITLDGVTSETPSFYIFKTEISNLQYLEFLHAISEKEMIEDHKVKSDNWIGEKVNLAPYKEHYHTHAAYRNYPVVNVTKASAVAYCEWLTEHYKQIDIGLPEGYQIVFRLPTREEWVRAANGAHGGPYAWGGPFLRNAKGCFLANFAMFGHENIHRDLKTGTLEVVPTAGLAYKGISGCMNDNADVLAPVDAYAPNHFGLKNMNGNAAEMLADTDQVAGGSWRSPGFDVRNESLMLFEGASPEVGFRPVGIVTAVD